MWRGVFSGVRAMLVSPSASPRQAVAEETHGIVDLDAGDAVGEYVIVKKLGEGGFGTVYEAAHPVIGKRAAVKVLHAQYSSDADVTSRFVAEARAVNQIRHRNIVDIFAFGDLPDGRHYYVMELLDGAPLDLYLDRAGRMPPEEAIPMLHAVAKALGAAHAAGIAHRDLKPENVFLELDEDGCVDVKILDFGIAKLISPGALATHKTRSGIPIGSPRYMSPEQCRGVQVDHRTDVYAFGCMAYRVLTGLPPFEARTALELMMTHVSIPPSPPSVAYPSLPIEFDEPILKMLEKEPDARPATMLAAFDSLAVAASKAGCQIPGTAPKASSLLRDIITERRGIGPTALDVSKRPRPLSPVPPPRSRSKLPAMGVLITLCVAATVLALVVLRHRRTTAPSSPPPSAAVHSAWPTPAQALTAPRFPALSGQTAPRAPLQGAVPGSAADAVAETSPTVGAIAARAGQADASPSPDMVSILVRSQPVRADIYLNDEKVGVTPGPILMPRADNPQSLVLKAPGYSPATVTVRSAVDSTLHVVLTPSTPPAPPARLQRPPSVPRDLENPY